jgi:hypothetical protein
MRSSNAAHAHRHRATAGATLALALAGGPADGTSAFGTARAKPEGAITTQRARTTQAQRARATQVQQAHSPRAQQARATQAQQAGAARVLSVDDTGDLHLLKAFGSVLLEEGHAGGTLPGLANVRMTVGPTVTASFAIRAHYGTIYGSGRAVLHSSGRYSSFAGTLSVSHGTGSYAGAHGDGRLYGVIDRRTSALTVQTLGVLRY